MASNADFQWTLVMFMVFHIGGTALSAIDWNGFFRYHSTPTMWRGSFGLQTRFGADGFGAQPWIFLQFVRDGPDGQVAAHAATCFTTLLVHSTYGALYGHLKFSINYYMNKLQWYTILVLRLLLHNTLPVQSLPGSLCKKLVVVRVSCSHRRLGWMLPMMAMPMAWVAGSLLIARQHSLVGWQIPVSKSAPTPGVVTGQSREVSGPPVLPMLQGLGNRRTMARSSLGRLAPRHPMTTSLRGLHRSPSVRV